MAEYRNDTKGARAIHLTNGGYRLVEPGATFTIESGKVRRIAPGIVKSKADKALPKPSAAAVKAVTAKAPAKRKAPRKAAAKPKAG